MSTHRAAPQHAAPRVERGTVSRFMQQSKQKKQAPEDPDAGWSTVRRKRRGRNPPPPPPPLPSELSTGRPEPSVPRPPRTEEYFGANVYDRSPRPDEPGGRLFI